MMLRRLSALLHLAMRFMKGECEATLEMAGCLLTADGGSVNSSCAIQAPAMRADDFVTASGASLERMDYANSLKRTEMEERFSAVEHRLSALEAQLASGAVIATPQGVGHGFAGGHDGSRGVGGSTYSGARKTADTRGLVYAFIAFDQTGFGRVQAILAQRAARYGWRTFGGGPCHPETRGRTDADGSCHSVANGDVVALFASTHDGATPSIQYCERVPRPCRYITLLRHPISRLLSSYSYFCEGCAEGGRQCRGWQDPERLTCPNMTRTAYAAYFGDLYTQTFAPKGLRMLGPEYSGLRSPVDLADYFLRSVFVMLYEVDFKAERPLARFAAWTGDRWLATQVSDEAYREDGGGATLPEGESAAIRKMLRNDLELWTRVSSRATLPPAGTAEGVARSREAIS